MRFITPFSSLGNGNEGCEGMAGKHRGRILRVTPGSLAEEIGLRSGDCIVEVNETPLRDIIDLSFAMADEEIDLLVEHADGEQEMISFDKDADEELGAEFESAVFDGIRCCANHCCFCFVDMVAPDMRQSLSVKDDDYRMSFLYGNFITLSNMVEADYKRIEQFHLSPLYVSVHTMNPDLRAQMLRCKRAGEIHVQLDRLEAAGTSYHTQVVLCSGLNDGKELSRTIQELIARRPHVLSLAVVPVGITKHRKDPFPLHTFDRKGAEQVIAEAEVWQRKLRQETGRTFLYLSDEFYLLAGQEVPEEEAYDGFPQLDNGIGLTRNFLCEWEKDPSEYKKYEQPMRLDVLSGTAAAPVLQKLAEQAMERDARLKIRILPVTNEHFGETVNVSGLLTGKDMERTLREAGGKRDGILLPESALRSGEDIFLDDMSLQDLRKIFSESRIETVRSGADFRHALSDFPSYRRQQKEHASYMWQSNAAYTK